MKQTKMSKREFLRIASEVQEILDERDIEVQKIANIVKSKIDEQDTDYLQVANALMKEFTKPLNDYYGRIVLKIISYHGDLNDFFEYVFEFSNNSKDNYWNCFFENLEILGLMKPFEIQNMN